MTMSRTRTGKIHLLSLPYSKLTDELRNNGYVCHTIIPELDKFSPDNQVGMHTSPISVAVPCYGWIAFLSSKTVKQKKKGDLVDLANKLQVQSTGTVAEITSRIQAYSNSQTKKDSQNNVKGDQIHFWDCEEQPSFEAMVCADNELMYGAECSKKTLMSFQVEKDGVGLKGTNQQVIVQYSPGWRKINNMCLCGSSIFISQCQGVSKINLESGECRLLVELVDGPCVLTRFGSDVFFTNQKKSSVFAS